MWVKICGNTRLDDCLVAAELGADAVGFIFAPSKRRVTAEQVAAISAKLPPTLEKIGVFTTLDADEIITAVQIAGLTGVQLHTFEPVFDLLQRMRQIFGTTNRRAILQVVHRWTDVSEAEQGDAFAANLRSIEREGNSDAVLIDSRTHEGSGGTGKTFNWQEAWPMLAQLQIPVIAAGGLRPENVADAVRALRPWGVDVSSGVEDAPGIKSREKISDFIRNARSA